jgi:hypothetical protein
MSYSPSSHYTGYLCTLFVCASELCHALNFSSAATLNTSSSPLILVADILKVSEPMPDSDIRGEDLVGLRRQWDSESAVAQSRRKFKTGMEALYGRNAV